MKTNKHMPVYAAVASILLSGVVLIVTFSYVQHLARQRFEGEVAKVRQSFIEKATASELLANNLQSFAQIDPDMSREDFQTFVEGIMNHYPFVRGTNLYRFVKGADRAQHEVWLSQHTDVNQIVDSSNDDPDATVPSAPQARYFSLIYADRAHADNTVFGWNVLSDGRRQTALLKAVDSTKAEASDGFLLDDGHASVEVFIPFYRGAAKSENIVGVIGMTIDLPLLLGDEEWRKNVTVILSTALAGSDRLRDLYRSLDKEPEGIMRLSSMETEVDLNTFGQNLRLLFVKELFFSRLNYGILLLVIGGCLVVTFLTVNLARTLLNLAALNANLEHKVLERTRDLAKTNAEIQEILDKLDDGILIMDRTLAVDARFSPATPGLLGVKDLAGRSVKDLLFAQLDPHQEEASKHNFTLPMLFGADDFQWSISHENLLRRMSYRKTKSDGSQEERQFSLRYAPLYDEQGNIQRILLVISDVTEILALRRFVEEARQQNDQRMQMVMEILQADRQAMQGFMSEAENRAKVMRENMAQLRPDFPKNTLQAIFREVHTFKGNARMMKLQGISRAAHVLEDDFADEALSGKLAAESGEELITALDQLLQLFASYHAVFKDLFDQKQGGDRAVELRREWLEVLRLGFSARTLTHLLESQNSREVFSFGEIWKSYQGMVDDIAGHLSKQVKPLQMRGNIYLKTSLQTPIKDALTHLVRNALDHGIETPEQRSRAGKSADAELRAAITLRDDVALVEVQDDGRGVDSDKVWQLAQERGVVNKGTPRPSDPEVWELLFHPGFSTKAEASDISGRGVGLDAVRSFLGEFGCRVEIHSQQGKGTSFRLVIPLKWVSALWNENGTLWDTQAAPVARAS